MRGLLVLLTALLALTACSDDEADVPEIPQLPIPDMGKAPSTGDQWGGGPLAEPLSFHEVREVQHGACDPADKLAVEDKEGGSCLVLKPAAFVVDTVDRARTVQVNGQWQLQLRLTADDAAEFRQLTARAAQEQDLRNRVAVVFGERELLVAPAVQQPVTGRTLAIAGPFQRADLDELLERMGG
ncbi:SecDF P1 head subdomain-containing protein [Thermocrispum municipale]|uniref:SecDF P1 head subdomain-containing protein n=1 Tax=Thermocrispum municipale TaxID=37926 RepID=UPI00040C496C|nr:hypothetical protein [Thermocrispum municipale]